MAYCCDGFYSNSTAKDCKSQLKRSCRDSINESIKRLICNGPNFLSIDNSSEVASLTSIREALSVLPATTQDSRATVARSTKARSTPRMTRSEARALSRVVLGEETQLMKRGRRGWGIQQHFYNEEAHG